MKYKVKFQEFLFEELKSYLFANSPDENGCYLLGEVRDSILCITKIIYPKEDDDIYGCIDYCSPSPSFTSRACTLAKKNNQSLLFVHSHPLENQPSTFSFLDIESNQSLFKNLFPILKSLIGSIVFSKKGIHGVIFNNEEYFGIDSYTVIGKSIQIIKDVDIIKNEIDKELFDRQLLFMSDEKFKQYQNLNVCIIGCGGTGTPTAITLAKSGVKNITIYDYDKIEIHNLPRIDCASRKDIGRYKAEVVKEFIEKISEAKILARTIDISESISELLKFDIILGCVDNHTIRAKINEQAIKYAIPFIDIACSIPLDKEKNIVQAVVSTSIVYPLSSCLWCLKSIDAIKINQESLSKTEKESLSNEGYLVGVDSAPSIKTLTALSSAKATSRIFNILGIYNANIPLKEIEDISGGFTKKLEVTTQECLCKVRSPFSVIKQLA